MGLPSAHRRLSKWGAKGVPHQTPSRPRGSAVMGKDLVRISRFLSLVLRHDPGRIGLELDREGWASVAGLASTSICRQTPRWRLGWGGVGGSLSCYGSTRPASPPADRTSSCPRTASGSRPRFPPSSSGFRRPVPGYYVTARGRSHFLNHFLRYSCVRRKLEGVELVPCHSFLYRTMSAGTSRTLSA